MRIASLLAVLLGSLLLPAQETTTKITKVPASATSAAPGKELFGAYCHGEGQWPGSPCAQDATRRPHLVGSKEWWQVPRYALDEFDTGRDSERARVQRDAGLGANPRRARTARPSSRRRPGADRQHHQIYRVAPSEMREGHRAVGRRCEPPRNCADNCGEYDRAQT
jgi:hypothetical protein